MSLYFVRLQDAKESEGSVLHVCNAPFLWESCESKSFLVMNQYFPLPWFPPVMHLCGQGRWLGQQEDPTRGSYSEFLLSGEEGTAWMEENVAGIDRFVDRHCFFFVIVIVLSVGSL